tara:strand:+ start:52 stop:915 length:864 start_codon:yes stop_codon:yes gene_type:complete
MPELPEVEIVKQSLSKKIKSGIIKKVLVRNRNLRFKIPNNFEKNLKNKVVIKINRLSKYIILELSDQMYLIMHLGMSGTIHLINKDSKNSFTNTSFYSTRKLPKKHNHIEILFSKFKIIYNDPRRFGFFKIINGKKKLNFFFSKLGPEPFSKFFNYSYLLKSFKNKKKNIKNFLIDQKFVSGIGNIYASEILYYSGIDPFKEANKIAKHECKKIINFSKIVLKDSIKKGGSSIRDFKNTSGIEGLFQKNFKVYQRNNLNCLKKNCSGIIMKKFISKRSTFFCNNCQK